MRLTYRYRLYPTETQSNEIRQTCSAVRYLYNRLLEERTNTFRETGKWAKLATDQFTQHPWMKRVDPSALLAAENQLNKAYDVFFRALRNKPDRYRPEALSYAALNPAYRLTETDLIHYPRFKRKKTTAESYQTKPEGVMIEEKAVVLPVVGRVRAKIHRPLPENSEIQKCTVLKKRSGRFYLLLLIELPDQKPETTYHRPMGIVFSPGELVQRSDGKEVTFRHMDPDLEKRINQAYQTLQRRKPGSKRWEAQRQYLAKLYEKRVEQRRDDHHKAARQIANDADVICMEAPEVLIREKRLKKTGLYDIVHDEAWWKFSYLVEQKVRAQGHYFWRVPRFHNLFGMCSICGNVQVPVLKSDTFQCTACGACMDRKENAMQALHQEAAQYARQLSMG